jgi:formylglycine-generating enzyme required for sulfatase activity
LNGVDSPYECEGYRLPTEAEREYAARAGTTTAFSTGDLDETHIDCATPFTLLTDVAWYCANAGGEPHPVAGLAKNAYGLYDMHGGADEWVGDWYGDYPTENVKDPVGPASGTEKVYRGGAWGDGARYCRAANRGMLGPAWRNASVGMRIARTAP